MRLHSISEPFLETFMTPFSSHCDIVNGFLLKDGTEGCRVRTSRKNSSMPDSRPHQILFLELY